MNTKLVSLLVCTLALAACDKGPGKATSAPVAATPAAPVEPVGPPPPAAPEGSKRVVATVGEGEADPLKLVSGASVGGSYTPTEDGTLVAFGVYIGNSRKSADGTLTLNLCQLEDCQDVTLPLANSRDNDYLIFTLPRPIPVTTTQALTYKLLRGTDATIAVSIWTYPTADGAVALTGTSGEDTGRMAKVAMFLQGATP
jgi:hypothetical protein